MEKNQDRIFLAASRFLTALMLVSIMGCSSAGKVKVYKFTTSFDGSTTDVLRSDLPLEGGKTYRVFFTLQRPEDCIRISAAAAEIPAEGAFVRKSPRIYLIAERAVDLRKFSQRENDFVFTELGRNYTQNWEYLDYLLVCSAAESPLKTLRPGKYRLRLSSLDDSQYTFSISIGSDNGAVVFSRDFQ